MDTQTVSSPALDTVYPFRTVTLSGSSYRIENRTPYTLYIAPKSTSSAADCVNQSSLTVLPFNTARLGYVNANAITVVLKSDVARIVLPQDVNTFISFTTLLQTEQAEEYQTSSAISTYNPASLEINVLPASTTTLTALAQTYLPSASGQDIFGWNGVYFSYATFNSQDSIYGFVEYSATGTFAQGDNVGTYDFCCGSGFMMLPRLQRYIRVSLTAAPDWLHPLNYVRYAMRRTTNEIEPNIWLRTKTQNWTRTTIASVGSASTVYVPVNPPSAVISIYNQSGVNLPCRILETALSGISPYSPPLEHLIVPPGRLVKYPVTPASAYWITVQTEVITVPTTWRVFVDQS